MSSSLYVRKMRRTGLTWGDEMLRRVVYVAAIAAAAITCSEAQWVNYPTPGIPRTDARWQADFSGIWQVEPSPSAELKPLVGNLNDVFAPGDDLMDFSKYAIDILADFKPKEEPMRPEAAAAMRRERNCASLNMASKG
jgi:hypothetical protein